MILGRDLIGMPIYSLDRGEKIGEVENLIFDPDQGKVIGLVLEEGGLFRSSQVIPFESIENIGPDAIVLKRGAPMEMPPGEADSKLLKESFNLTGRKVLSEGGYQVGVVNDLDIDEQTGRVTGIEVTRGIFQDTAEGRKHINHDQVQQIGKHAIIVSQTALETLAAQKGGLSATFENMRAAGVESLERVRSRSGAFGTTAREKRASWGKTAQEQIDQLRERSRTHLGRGRTEASRLRENLSAGLERARLKAEGYFDWLRDRILQRRIDQAIGRRVSRTILDPSDHVILQQGEMITYNAIQRANEAGVLDILLDSVVKENLFALRRKETQSASEEVFAKRPSPPKQEEKLQRSA